MAVYREYLSSLRNVVEKRDDVELKTITTLRYQKEGREYPYEYVRIISKDIQPNDPILLIRATIHGDEASGSFTILEHFDEIFETAHSRGVKVIMYPVDNPSGFELHTRYNIEDDSGDAGNNDGLRYELQDGTIIDDIGTGKEWKQWYWASDPKVGVRLPKETQTLLVDLKTLPLQQIQAVVDIHQDNYIVIPGAYGYAFGDTAQYRAIVDEIETFTHVFRNEHVDSKHLNGPSYTTEKAGRGGTTVPDAFDPVTDDVGLIQRHDGGLTDLLYQLGTKHCITIETTTCAPTDVCDRVNMVWILGLVKMMGKR